MPRAPDLEARDWGRLLDETAALDGGACRWCDGHAADRFADHVARLSPAGQARRMTPTTAVVTIAHGRTAT